MKTRLIAAAIAVALAGHSHASTTYNISSNVTNAEFWSENFYLIPSPGSVPASLAFGGTAIDVDDDGTIDSSNVTLSGETQFYMIGLFSPAPLIARAVFSLNSGSYTPAVGVTFTGGSIAIDVWTTTSGWTPYGTIDASVTNLPFFAGQPASWGLPYTTAGLLLIPGNTGLPGRFVPPASGFNNAVIAMYMLGMQTGLFMEGTLMLTP